MLNITHFLVVDNSDFSFLLSYSIAVKTSEFRSASHLLDAVILATKNATDDKKDVAKTAIWNINSSLG